MADKTLVCKDCNQEFTFTEGEQEFYKEKGFEKRAAEMPRMQTGKETAEKQLPQRKVLRQTVIKESICSLFYIDE